MRPLVDEARSASSAGSTCWSTARRSFLAGDLARPRSLADWERQFALNLRAPFLLCQAFARGAAARGGERQDRQRHRRAGAAPRARPPRLSASRRRRSPISPSCWPLELAPRVTVNAVAPGAMLPPPGDDEEAFARRVATRRTAAAGRRRRRRSPTAVLYFLREDFVTGVVLPVDGGEYL